MTNKFQIDAILRKFWWLVSNEGDYTPLIDKERVEEFSVSRISEDFLDKKPFHDGANGNLVGINDDERILLLDQYGFEITEVRQAGYIVNHRQHTDDEQWEGETVGEALLRLENPNEVAFALVLRTGHKIVNHHSAGGYTVILYKPPKGFQMLEWLEEKKAKATARLEAELAEIDAEAKQL